MKKVFFYILNFLIVGFFGFALVDYRGVDTDGVYKCFTTPIWYIIALAVTVVLSTVLSVAEYKFEYYEKFFSLIKNGKKRIFAICGLLFSSAVLSLGFEYILAKFVFGPTSTGAVLSIYRFLFVFAVCFLITYIIYVVVSNTVKVENLFAVISLSTGFVMILCAPFGHICWDIDSHYKSAVAQSNPYALFTKADYDVYTLEGDFLVSDVGSKNANFYQDKIAKYNENDKKVYGVLTRKISIPRIPASVAIAVARLFKFSFNAKINLIKFTNLLLYTLVCFLAIKRLKSGKIIMFVIALMPTNMFLAANVTYDWWVNSFIMLGMAFVLSEMQQPDKVMKPVESIIMCALFMFACLPKQVYFPILVIPFLIYKPYFKTDKKSRNIHYLICFSAIVVILASLFLRFGGSVSSGGDMRGGEGVNPSGQVGFILSSPFKYTVILLKFLSKYLSFPSAQYYINSFAYLGMGAGYQVILTLLIIAVFTDKNEYDKKTSSVWLKVIFLVLSFSAVCLVATSLYVNFTPVGLETINGCQERYLTPVIIVLLPIIGSLKINNKLSRRFYDSAFAAVSSAVLFVDIYQCMVSNML